MAPPAEQNPTGEAKAVPPVKDVVPIPDQHSKSSPGERTAVSVVISTTICRSGCHVNLSLICCRRRG
jgi:hypothetical protein